jgi:hypothetical protein
MNYCAGVVAVVSEAAGAAVSAGAGSTGAGAAVVVVSSVVAEESPDLPQEAATTIRAAANKNLNDFFIRFWFKISFHTKSATG